MNVRAILFLVLLLCCAALLFGGTTGKIAGKIVDAKTKEPLFGVNILVVGTSYGASTDLDGNYTILNLSPNIYTLKTSLLGYTPVTISNIKVSIDLTTRQDFELSESAVQVNEIVIVAERPLIQKDLTAKTAVISADQIRTLPVTEVGQLLSLQAGFVAGSLRGGRSGEVAYWLDGVPVTDVYDGAKVVEVNKNLIQEVELVSGAFNAEYGQAMSGIVNIATKEGGQKYSGNINVYGGDYLSSENKIFPGVSSFSPTAIRNFEASLSGPVVGNDLTFFANGRYIYFGGYLNGYRRFNPWNIAYTDSTGAFHLYRDAAGKGDSSAVSMNASERKYGQGKLTWHVSPALKISGNFIYDNTQNQRYNRQFYYDPDGLGKEYTRSNTFIFQLTHTLSSNMFYTLGASYFDKEFKYYLFEDPYDPGYVHPKLFTQQDGYSFFTGGTDMNRFRRLTITKLAKFDLSDQVNQAHLVKFGTEFRLHRISFENIQLQPIQSQSDIDLAYANPFIKTSVPDISSLSHDVYEHRPKEFSGYLQDKIELKDLIINIGVRFDYFDPDGIILNDESDPNIFDPIKPGNRFFDQNGNGIQDPGEVSKTVGDRQQYWYRKASKKIQWSPRFGASFPITAGGVVHFSYGHFFQIPRFERLFENPFFKLGLGTGNQGVVGNADLEPEQTINGELGIQQQLGDDISVDLTAYLRDIRNLTGTRADEIVVFGGSKSYSKYVNSDFGFVKGIVFTLNKRFGDGFTATADYTYQVARGSASDPNEARNARVGGSLPEVQLTPLGWDQRHTLNITASYTKDRWGVSCIGQYGSGTAYTPRQSIDITTLLTNSQTKPSFLNVDLRANYEIPLDALRLVLFTRMFNVLDTRNETGVFNDTGQADFTTDEAKARATNPSQRVNTLDQWYTVPTFYSEPRRIEFGATLEF
jgi:outer membrane receptor protein involved in Fe transport